MPKPGDPQNGELFIGADVPTTEKVSPVSRQGPKPVSAKRTAILSFARRMMLFWLPMVLFVAAIEVLLWRVGETWPLKRAIRVQEINPRAIYLRGVLDQGTFHYKYAQIVQRRPEILVLGSSRVQQFRAEMFGRQASVFYNGGGTIRSVEDLNTLLDRLPENATPKTIILGVDFWWLNANARRTAIDAFEDGVYVWEDHANAFSVFLRQPEMLWGLVTHSVGKNRRPDAIGLQALLYGIGFRRDGSKQLDLELWKERLPELRRSRMNVAKGDFPFVPTDGVSTPLMEQLRATLLKLKERGVFIIAYSPPVVTEWAGAAAVAPGYKEYWQQYHEKIPALFRSLGLYFFVVPTPQQIGLDDRYMRDGYHAHDTFNLHLLQRFCQEPEIRNALSDVPAVAQKALTSPATTPLHLDLGL